MPTYSRLTINLSPNEEKQIKQMAKEKGKSISAYCRETLLGGVEEPLCRVTIESQIEQLEKKVNRLSKIMMDLSRENIGEIHMNSNLVMGFFDAVIDDDEVKQKIYKEAKAETKEYLANVFGEEKKK